MLSMWTIVLKYVHKSYLASIPVSTCCKGVLCVYDYDEDKYILKSFYVSIFGLLQPVK